MSAVYVTDVSVPLTQPHFGFDPAKNIAKKGDVPNIILPIKGPIITTPTIGCPFPISKYGTISLSFDNLEADKDLQHLAVVVGAVEAAVKTEVGGKSLQLLGSILSEPDLEAAFKSSVYHGSGQYAPSLSVKTLPITGYFDPNQSRYTATSQMPERFTGRAVIQPAFVWFKNGEFGVRWNLLNLQVLNVDEAKQASEPMGFMF